MEHVYQPAVVSPWDLPWNLIRKARARIGKNDTATIVRKTNKVVVFAVGSASLGDNVIHNVVLDKAHGTYRCSCPAGFYGQHCHHVQMAQEARFR